MGLRMRVHEREPIGAALRRFKKLIERSGMKGELRAQTDRRPLHLYPLLEQRGFTGETEEQSDGSFVTTIRRV